MDADRLRRLGLTDGRKRAPAPTEESVGEWRCMYDEAQSVAELARRLDRRPGTIRYHLERHGIEIRGKGYRSPKTVRHRGSDHANWKGGTYRHSDGYVYEYTPDHPDARKGKGYVLQHRLVVERHLGRRLGSAEIVHHRNEDKTDNRIENLLVTSRSAHMKGHKAGFPRDRQGRFS